MFSIAILSPKGGVGKTLTCANLAAALADLGEAVLLVDFDPQSDLSTSLGCEAETRRARIEDALADATSNVGDALEHVPLGNGLGSLAVLATRGEPLRARTAQLLSGDARQLQRLLESLDQRFDVALIDTPAGDTIFGRQALAAADAAIVPTLPGFHELRALTRALDVFDAHAAEADTTFALLGALVVNADARWRSTKEYGEHLAAMAADGELALFDTVIPRHQPVTDHARYGTPTVWLRPKSSVAEAYRRLAPEVLARIAARGESAPDERAARSAGAFDDR